MLRGAQPGEGLFWTLRLHSWPWGALSIKLKVQLSVMVLAVVCKLECIGSLLEA